MSYARESKKAFIQHQTELFAHELYLNHKHYKNRNENIDLLLNTFLNAGWFLEDKERQRLKKNAIKIAREKYNINIMDFYIDKAKLKQS